MRNLRTGSMMPLPTLLLRLWLLLLQAPSSVQQQASSCNAFKWRRPGSRAAVASCTRPRTAADSCLDSASCCRGTAAAQHAVQQAVDAATMHDKAFQAMPLIRQRLHASAGSQR
ncbi:hypothetical protein COO60DRAFT_137335 [Scenedesmus sp. NREL 46B-D3]|nr:hypothetical protein COO60DRAFT_137335 [Scenedesmus sp. NREL 46B-D3]